MRRRFNTDLTAPRRAPLAEQLTSAPIVAVAVDVGAEAAPINAALLDVTARMLATLPEARLACLNVLKSSAMAIDTTLDKEGHNKQIDRLVRLKAWAAPLKLDERRLTAHVLEGTDPAGSILEFVTANRVDHVLIGARQDSFRRRVLGSVSAKVATEAACSVTIVRTPRVPEAKPRTVPAERLELRRVV